MELSEFVVLVKKMRGAQKSYFAARSKGANCGDILAASKDLEKRVDKAVKEIEESKHGKQSDLF